MKTFRSLEVFEKKVKDNIVWEDYFKVKGRVFRIYEYGGGSMMKMDYDYVYFLNKKTNDLIYIKYIIPLSVKDTYRFISLEYIENAYLWR